MTNGTIQVNKKAIQYLLLSLNARLKKFSERGQKGAQILDGLLCLMFRFVGPYSTAGSVQHSSI